MKFKTFFVFAFAFCTLFFTSISFGAESNTSNSPSALFPETRFEFQPVVGGIDVIHSFVVKNKGTASLEIEKVRAG